MVQKEPMEKKDWIIIGSAIIITIFFYSFCIVNELYRTCKGSQIIVMSCMIFIVGVFCYKRPRRYEQYFLYLTSIVIMISMSIFLLCDTCGG